MTTSQKKMTKEAALKIFKESYMAYDFKKDKIAAQQAWHTFTDGLCKDGYITVKQYESWNTPKELK